MKKELLFLLILIFLFSCAKKQAINQNEKSYLAEQVNQAIRAGKVGSNPLFYMNEEIVPDEEISLLNKFGEKDFISITFLNSHDALEKYGPGGKNGAVLITPFKDEKLDVQYYEGIQNKIITDIINENVQKGLVRKNPVIVVSGIPLRGEEIAARLNSLPEKKIKDIQILRKPAAYSIYGIRAINGVLLIEVNY
jgi:hypothetical protein